MDGKIYQVWRGGAAWAGGLGLPVPSLHSDRRLLLGRAQGARLRGVRGAAAPGLDCGVGERGAMVAGHGGWGGVLAVLGAEWVLCDDGGAWREGGCGEGAGGHFGYFLFGNTCVFFYL